MRRGRKDLEPELAVKLGQAGGKKRSDAKAAAARANGARGGRPRPFRATTYAAAVAAGMNLQPMQGAGIVLFNPRGFRVGAHQRVVLGDEEKAIALVAMLNSAANDEQAESVWRQETAEL